MRLTQQESSAGSPSFEGDAVKSVCRRRESPAVRYLYSCCKYPQQNSDYATRKIKRCIGHFYCL